MLYRVDAGGPAIRPSTAGRTGPRTKRPQPLPQRRQQRGRLGSGATTDGDSSGQHPNAIFDTERWTPSDNPPMQWAFPVTTATAAGAALLRQPVLRHLAAGAAGLQRDHRRHTVLTNYDIVADVGDQRGTMKAFNITSDGTVNIDFCTHREPADQRHRDHPHRPAGPAAHRRRQPHHGRLHRHHRDRRPTPTTRASTSATGVAAFAVGNKVFYGYTDGYLYYRTMTGSTLGPGNKIDPYNDPYWSNVDTGDGTTFRGMVPSLYGQIPNLTGMFFSGGRLYYTLFGDSHLYSRWFSPDSGIVDETTTTSSSSVDFSLADGMFAVGTTLYYGSARRQPALGVVQRRHRLRQPDGGQRTGYRRGQLDQPGDVPHRRTSQHRADGRVHLELHQPRLHLRRLGLLGLRRIHRELCMGLRRRTNGSGVNPTHAYTADGTFTVT